MRIDDAVKLIKGPKGTNVILTLKKVDGNIIDLSIPRDVIELEETYAKSSYVEKEGKTFGVINLPKFYADFDDYNKRNAASDIKKEIERLKAEGMEGLVLDLRNNGGGSLKTVVDMAGLFIKDGPIVQVRSTGEPQEVLQDRDRSIAWDGPLVILVNELSASASEILAAAMQDYKRAIVIGSKQTYGKGTVQIVLDLNRMVRNNTNGDMGALKFTTQKFYRINGGSTQLEGVKSDVVVPDRYSYIDIGERDQENPLAWDKIAPAEYTIWDSYFDYDATIEKSKERMQNSEQLKLIDENAKWIKTIRDRNVFSLNYEDYRKKLEANEEEAKRFDKISEYTTNLTFKSLPYENVLVEKDSVLKMKRDRWHESLAKDVYIEEALNVLNDLKNMINVLASETFSAVSAPIQYAAIKAYENDHSNYIAKSINILSAIGKYVFLNLKSNKVLINEPQGGFYLMPEFLNNKFKTSSEMCGDILHNTGVALLPGSDFGFNPDKMLARLSFTDFDGQEFMNNIDENKKIDENLINKFAPKVVEGVNKLKNWSETL